MSKMVFKKVLGHLVPADETAIGFVRKCKPGELVMVDGRRPRNIRHHRKLWALLNLVVDNTDRYPSTDVLLYGLKIATGHCDILVGTDGSSKFHMPHSISFESMDQTAFEKFYDAAVDVICRHIIPGTDSAALRAEVESMLEPTY